MSATTYAVGRGEPPPHTRLADNQSGNPGGEPGPAKLLRERFQRALYEALEKRPGDLAPAKSEDALAAAARQLVLDASSGRTASQRLLLSLLDAEIAQSAKETEREGAGEPGRNEAEFSLVQGTKQGRKINRALELCEMLEAEEAARRARAEARRTAAAPAQPAETKPPAEKVTIGAAAPLAAKLLQGTSSFAGFPATASRGLPARPMGP
jgi:hypothetical protein